MDQTCYKWLVSAWYKNFLISRNILKKQFGFDSAQASNGRINGGSKEKTISGIKHGHLLSDEQQLTWNS